MFIVSTSSSTVAEAGAADDDAVAAEPLDKLGDIGPRLDEPASEEEECAVAYVSEVEASSLFDSNERSANEPEDMLESPVGASEMGDSPTAARDV